MNTYDNDNLDLNGIITELNSKVDHTNALLKGIDAMFLNIRFDKTGDPKAVNNMADKINSIYCLVSIALQHCGEAVNLGNLADQRSTSSSLAKIMARR